MKSKVLKWSLRLSLRLSYRMVRSVSFFLWETAEMILEEIERMEPGGKFARKYDENAIKRMAVMVPEYTPLRLREIHEFYPELSKNTIYKIIHFKQKFGL